MSRQPRRSSLVLVLLAWLTVVAIAASLLITAEIRRLEQGFTLGVKSVSADVDSRLRSYEAVLSGFSAFLYAVEADDLEAITRYAATIATAHPEIYMIEVARRVSAPDAEAFVEALRQGWRSDFAMRSFAEITGRQTKNVATNGDLWPILFVHPDLPEVESIYGLRLETVDHLAGALAWARDHPHAVASPVFEYFEGGSGYILLRKVEREESRRGERSASFFGDDLMAMLMIRSEALIPALGLMIEQRPMRITANLSVFDDTPGLLFDVRPPEQSALEQALLPVFRQTAEVGSAAQRVVLEFEQQYGFEHVFGPVNSAIIAILLGGILIAPWFVLRHFKALKAASIEHEHAAYLATHDVLTGLPNRFLLADRFSHALHNWERNGARFALLLVDLDWFKGINDEHGHEVGDQVLRVVAERMSSQLRAFDTVARYGGDEFVILVLNVLDPTDAVQVGDKLLAAVSRPINTPVGPVDISCSIGVALCPDHGKDLDALRRQADISMYEAKQAGRGAVVLTQAEKN